MHHISHALYNRSIALRRAFVALFFACAVALPAAAQDAYRLGPGDRIALRIVAWDTIALAFVEYGALNGEYVVDSSGTVMVPMLGAVHAQGESAAELADKVASQLQGRLGLVEPPSASIAVVGYRPIYILGAVGQPGAYAFSPGLTVQQALALAGGIDPVLDEGPDGVTAAIRAAGTLREIGIDLARQKIRAARLRAEMKGETDLALPKISDHPAGAEAVAAIAEHERNLFLSRREALERAIAALEGNQVLLETEIAALEEKQAGQSRQVKLLRESVGKMESLVERGLARSPNFVALQGQLIDLENRELDTETAVFRARQAIGDLKRDRVEIEATRKLGVLSELQQAETEIERLTVRQNMTRQLLVGAEALLAGSGEIPEFQPVFRITREGAAASEVLDASPGTRLQPSDVLEVEALTADEDS